jgi:hypothetical protein
MTARRKRGAGPTRGPWKWAEDGSLRGLLNKAIFYPSPRPGDTIRDLVNRDEDAELIVKAVNYYQEHGPAARDAMSITSSSSLLAARLRARAQRARLVSFRCDFYALPQAAQDALYGLAGELESIADALGSSQTNDHEPASSGEGNDPAPRAERV